MNLYSNKQKWKIALLIVALLLVGASLLVSNNIVNRVANLERERAEQWAAAIKKKIELVQFTNNTFSEMRDKEREKMATWIEATKEVSQATMNLNGEVNNFPLSIIRQNTEIPVILLDDQHNFSGARNLVFDTLNFAKKYPDADSIQLNHLIDDSLVKLSDEWCKVNTPFTVDIYDGFMMTYVYYDSKELVRLKSERDSLIQTFNDDLISNEGLVKVLLVDSKTDSIIGTNLDESGKALNRSIAELKKQNDPIIIDFNNGEKSELYFGNSPELKKLQYYPYIQFIVIGLFALIGYLVFSTFRKAEQNQVWAGMAKETAHQLGTPLSSLMAWIQMLESQGVDDMTTKEMQKDVDRLERISDRFSKIGSGASLTDMDIAQTVRNVVAYLRPRISAKVDIETHIEDGATAMHNASLIEWVIENICKNAVDAMEAEGTLTISLIQSGDQVHIDIRDTGKGIPQNQLKTIFQPGFSSKQRGWGLGLSLVRRIVKEYHKGRVFVLESQLDEGTTFRISLPAA